MLRNKSINSLQLLFMKIGYLGAGAWGSCLAKLLVEKGYKVKQWNKKLSLDGVFERKKEQENLVFTSNLQEVLVDIDIIVESVTAQGLRSVLEKILALRLAGPPIVLTSKGIEQHSGLLLSEVVVDVLGAEYTSRIGCISGPSLECEVSKKLPTSVVGASYDHRLMMEICDLFSAPYFRVYPNEDLAGVCFGGAMKNNIAIACAIADGLGFGADAKAALITRGLHEIRKLSVVKGCRPETINGLSGLGDLCATCFSISSRNYKFGRLLAEGYTPHQAQQRVGMVIEGMYTCIASRQLAQQHGIDIPITEAVYSIIYETLAPKRAVEALLSRPVKHEQL